MFEFETAGAVAVTVDVLSATVTVIASDRTDAVVRVRPADAAKKGDVRAAEQTKVEFAAGVLSVRTPKTLRTYTPFGGNPTIEVTIEVPTGSSLAGTAGVGRIVGEGQLGECDLNIAAGDIFVARPQGSVTAKVAKGDIRIGEAVRGIMRLDTSMGELEVGIHPGSAVRVESNVSLGAVSNQLVPVAAAGETVEVYARNTYGNIVIRNAA